MKHSFYALASLTLGLALVACQKESPVNPQPAPVVTTYALSASESFSAAGEAVVTVTASKAVTEAVEVTLTLTDETDFPAGSLSLTPSVVTIAATETTASATLKIETAPTAGTYKAVVAGTVGDTALEAVTINYVKEAAPALERVVGWYSGTDALWTTNVTAISVTHPDGYGMVRGLAMDDENIYMPKSSGYPAMAALSISAPATQSACSVSGVDTGNTFKSCFVRVIKNTDSSVNGGKDILLMSNLTEASAANLVVYAYKDGASAAPIKMAQFAWDSANDVADWRRYGDRFAVTGTYQSGKVYLPSFHAGKSVILDVANGERTAVTQITATDYSPSGIKDLTVYPGSNKLFLSNNEIANNVVADGTVTNGWNTYVLDAACENGKGTWGYNFFTFNGQKYIAYARISGNKAWVEIIEDKGDLITSLNDQTILFKSPIHSATDLDAEHATGGVADCCVRTINDVVYIAAMTRDGGFILEKLIMK